MFSYAPTLGKNYTFFSVNGIPNQQQIGFVS